MVARIQINRVDNISVSISKSVVSIGAMPNLPKNRAEVIKLIAIILVYSAIKISANNPLLYSTLKPDTSSDSPSAKSKGVRLVSARLVINHKISTGGTISISQEY